jgi:predicted nuclease of predicted toxin-antitoxin system
VKVLLDQSCPIGVIGILAGHEVTTAYRKSWDTLENGDLLAAAEAAAFDVIVTPDQNLQYQQNLTTRKIAIVVLSTNNWPVIREHALRVVDAVNRAGPGSFEEVSLPLPPLRRKPAPGNSP